METTNTGINGSSGYLLPDDLLLDILPRLSLCSLHRCFTVCKAWKETLVPVALSRRSHHHTSEFALMSYTYDEYPDYHLFLPEDDSHVHLKRNFGRNLVMSDGCNGLWLLQPLILRMIDPLYVGNPLTSKTVPLPVINLCPSYYNFSMIVFDPQVSCNYQVVIFGGQSSWKRDGEKLFEEIHLFSSRTGKWRSLDLRVKTPAPNVHVKVDTGRGSSRTFCVNGYAYRLGECTPLYPRYDSISSVFEFDIEKEVIECLDFPMELSTLETFNADLKLDVIKGYLVYVYANQLHTIIWRLDHDAADHSRRLWTSWYRIEMSTFSEHVNCNRLCCTIAFPGQYQEHAALFFIEDDCLWCFSSKDHKRVCMGNVEPALFSGNWWFLIGRLATFRCCTHDPDFSH